MKREIVRERYYKTGYVIRDEMWDIEIPSNAPQLMKRQAYNLQGEWIGNSKWAYRLIVKRGIMPEKSHSSHCVCSIGFCEKDQKWYGWSHRAICGFGIGDKLFEERWEIKPDHPKYKEYEARYIEKHGQDPDIVDHIMDVIPFIERGPKSIGTLDEAKQAAINFAEYVS